MSDCRESVTDRNYKGHINVTVSGKTCQLWCKTTAGKGTFFVNQQGIEMKKPNTVEHHLMTLQIHHGVIQVTKMSDGSSVMYQSAVSLYRTLSYYIKR